MTSTTTEEFFDAKYRASEDPWDFSRSPYELNRYQAILDCIGNHPYGLAFEPGCSVGILTQLLSTRCDWLEAYDISPAAVERASLHCSTAKNVHVFKASLSNVSPRGADLYLLCEVGYYLEQEQLAALLEAHVPCLRPGAVVIGCHWLGYSADHILRGDEVHTTIHGTHSLVHQYGKRHEGFRLDRWVKQEVQA